MFRRPLSATLSLSAARAPALRDAMSRLAPSTSLSSGHGAGAPLRRAQRRSGARAAEGFGKSAAKEKENAKANKPVSEWGEVRSRPVLHGIRMNPFRWPHAEQRRARRCTARAAGQTPRKRGHRGNILVERAPARCIACACFEGAAWSLWTHPRKGLRRVSHCSEPAPPPEVHIHFLHFPWGHAFRRRALPAREARGFSRCRRSVVD